ncbi:MAG TPA: tRNA (adenosine(37)-N6)-threonylcarbamoyltransferase complex dimerization subunit type 1 TsaB [Spongiibacteraceae bacterium]|nr:tRNA (adenosine(37)-N6)-threonylcarbamoyltransferase complex dimerization subunit type 1 TsaB [Spongiibacteraceae bacterium]HCS26968.1 tRNA (adenosine(37)-N6)-threonylcarbamoyltransferase complex dimerization subunit type 1 TsaB [Spongiibacteraceae bacterium]
MATVLALETSADACSVALLRSGEMVERHENLPRSHTQHILPMVDALLQSANMTLAQIDVIAFGRGPGSFTGLRVCASVVQGLAFAANIPCAPVSSLQALAMTAISTGLSRGHSSILCCVDARMSEVYGAQFSVQEGYPALQGEEFLCAPETVSWDSGAACRVGSGWRYAAEMQYQGEINDADLLPRAAAVALLGEQMYKSGHVVAAARAVPVYLRDDVAWR